MNKLKYLYRGIIESSNNISKSTAKNRFIILLDMFLCMLIYKASPINYEKFEFYRLPHKLRKTYVTNGISQKMIKKFNNPDFIYVFEDKAVFAQRFNDLYKRDYLVTSSMTLETFCEFVKGKEKFICKPIGGSQGQNIKVFKVNNNENQIFDEIKGFKGRYILEEWITQNEEVSKMYPNAVNCLRIITVHKDGKTHLITGGLTLGINDEIANGCLPSLVAPVDFSTGVISKPAASFSTELFEYHPTTNEKILGTKIPFWNEIVEMLNDAASRIPQVGYIGWDIAITPTGPVIIEGNTTPGYKYYQIPKHLLDGKGNKEKYVKFL